ncbi:serine/threonine-protein kinase [Nocardiopsis changdeensis]|uniref:non-specific serine/threonine protein kinase n=1 Tax=Nocardiopsis changdeensis TaxID=2831969 RepID=A0ABX8BIG2_9ACTN|nr:MULTISPECIES: serine/threonine-protein kinase [Nocardiopsis]QUX22006.1 serine/threonine protein kinase [Nocardiopsis changdeensis]QYX37943.1 protein kinase [Nocardiopsis sp. MT53]
MSSNSDSERIVANRYILRRELGRGGMGVVWEAFDPSLDRTVAIKQVLLPDHFTDEERADAHARVRREARSAARISHPSVITIHDVFDFEGDPWVVMELVEGGSLQDMLEQRGALDVETTATIAEALLKAVQAADAAGVLHRDIKPGNIMMSADGRVILTDFGIATMEGGPSITRTGALIGSPEYMPPERLEGGPAEHRGDLWSIGVTLFATVEGLSPFRRDSITAAIAAVLGSPLPPMRRAGRLTPVIAGLLERDPDRRLTVDGALALLDERGGAGAAAAYAGGHFPGPGPASDSGPVTAASGGYPSGPLTGPGTGYPSGPIPGGPVGGHPSGPLTGPTGGHPAGPGPGATSGPLSGPHPGMGGPSGPHTPPRPFPPHGPTTPGTPFGPSRPQPSFASHSGGHGPGHGGPTGGQGTLAPPRPPARSSGGVNKLLIGLGCGVLALVLIAVVAVGGMLLSNSGAEDPDPQADPSESALPGEQGAPVEPTPSNVPDDAGDDQDGPPSYEEMETFESQWFDVEYPETWTVDDSRIDESLVVFVAPGSDHQVWVAGWTEEEFTGTSAEYLEETKGGTDVEGDVTTDYLQLNLHEFGEDEYEDGWDVALVRSNLTNDTWPSPARRFWAYAVSMDHQGERVFYMVTVNVPRGDSGYYEELPGEVMDSFEPHL